MPDATGAVERFESLAAVRAEHARLLAQMPGDTLTPELRDQVLAFLARGAATGAVLDSPEDRSAAQGILNYWTATLYTPDQPKVPDVGLQSRVLAAFNEPGAGDASAAASAALAGLSEPDREAARRAVMRLVRLDPAGREFRAASAPRATLEAAGDPAAVDRAITALERAGLLRVTPGPTRGEDTVALRYESYIRTWDGLRNWLNERLRFRTAAEFWDRTGRKPESLLTDELLTDALRFRDLGALEQDFADASRDEADRRTKAAAAARAREEEQIRLRQRLWQRSLVVVAALVAALAVAIAVAAHQSAMETKARAEQDRIRTQAEQDAVVARTAAEKEKAEADRERAERKVAETERRRDMVQRVGNYTRMIGVLSDIVVAEGDAEQIARWRWQALEKELSDSPATAKFLTEHKKRVDGLLNARTRDARGRHALALAWVVRDEFVKNPNTELYGLMQSVREEAFAIGELVTNELVKAAEQDKGADAVRVYRAEFWRLYWGPLGMVEGNLVEDAMAKFGARLRTWEQTPGPAANDLRTDLAEARNHLHQMYKKERRVLIDQTHEKK